MSRLLLPLLLLGAALSAAEIQSYATRVELSPDGAGRATTTLVIAGAANETVEIPVGLKASGFLLASGPKGLSLESRGAAVKVVLPPEPGVWTCSFTFTATGLFTPEAVAEGEKARMPDSSRVVRTAFVHTYDDPIAAFSLEVVLPAGYRFQAIKEALPRPTKKEAEPRVRLGRADGRQTALLRATALKQGDSTSMVLEAVPSSRSLLWLVAGLGIALLYLYMFRDTIQSRH